MMEVESVPGAQQPLTQESAMGEPSTGTPPSEKPPELLLDSWKEIAAYVKRDITTVQRWEKREGMPVHRHLHDKRGSVYAYSSELDAWLQSRRLRLEEEEKEQAEETPPRADAEPGPKKALGGPPWLLLGALGVLILISVAGYVIWRSRLSNTPKIASLAVLPLKNLSGDPAQEYLAEGMTEAVIGRLSMIGGLRVISRTSVMQFKDPHTSVPEIAKMLHVDAVVEGSVIREGNRVRVHAQLIRGTSDEHFWSEEYDREFGDALALESDVAQAIAGKVTATITGQERARLVAARHVAPEVYESYLKGTFALDKENGRVGFEEGIGYFEEAIRRDPTFAPAYLGLANAYEELGTVLVGGPPDETRAKVTSAARKALELDPELAEAHDFLADVNQEQWRWTEAEAEYRRALELNPNDVLAHLGLANWLLCQGRIDEALSWSRRARELDPVGVTGLSNGWILFHARRYDEAIQELRSVVAVRPNYAWAHWFLGFALIGKGQPEEAIPELEKTVSMMHRSPGSVELLATAYASAGRRREAIRLINELKERRQKSYVPAGAFINPYLALRNYDEAFVWFERAYQEQSTILQFLKVHPFFDPVRNDPRFKDLLRRVNFPE
jgi:TolB-like protein/Tfp pilus assembly protein PilF